jgi:hypothetical protein
VGIIGLAAVGIPVYASSTYGLNQDFAAFPMVAAGGVVITALTILGIRLVFELIVTVVDLNQLSKENYKTKDV